MRYLVGLELGMGAEATALAVLERRRLETNDQASEWKPRYAVRHLHRFPPGTGYPPIVEAMVTLLKTPPMPGARVLIDYTGAGRPVCQLVLQGLGGRVDHSWTAVLLTAGQGSANPVNGEVNIAKTELIGTVQVLLQTRRLHVARELPHAPLLIRELENYRPKVTLPKADELAWRDGANDDLIFAVALAAWGGERELRAEVEHVRRPRNRWT